MWKIAQPQPSSVLATVPTRPDEAHNQSSRKMISPAYMFPNNRNECDSGLDTYSMKLNRRLAIASNAPAIHFKGFSEALVMPNGAQTSSCSHPPRPLAAMAKPIIRSQTESDSAKVVFTSAVGTNRHSCNPIAAIGLHEWRLVPTADVNTTFALSLSVWLLMIGFAIAAKGLGGWLHELVCAPFGMTSASLNPLKWIAGALLAIANLLFNFIEYVSKPLSHSLRLFGNMYAGEIIFLLLWLWASSGLVGTVASTLLGWGWAIFHILIVALQAYIFMMLTVVYLSLAREHH